MAFCCFKICALDTIVLNRFVVAVDHLLVGSVSGRVNVTWESRRHSLRHTCNMTTRASFRSLVDVFTYTSIYYYTIEQISCNNDTSHHITILQWLAINIRQYSSSQSERHSFSNHTDIWQSFIKWQVPFRYHFHSDHNSTSTVQCIVN